LNGIGGGSGW
jgi:hypothetical protein